MLNLNEFMKELARATREHPGLDHDAKEIARRVAGPDVELEFVGESMEHLATEGVIEVRGDLRVRLTHDGMSAAASLGEPVFPI